MLLFKEEIEAILLEKIDYSVLLSRPGFNKLVLASTSSLAGC